LTFKVVLLRENIGVEEWSKTKTIRIQWQCSGHRVEAAGPKDNDNLQYSRII